MTRAAIRVSIFVAIRIAACGADIDETKWRHNLDAGNQALKDADYPRARECYSEAMQMIQPLPPDHPLRALTLAALGSLEAVTAHVREAEQHFLEAREILDRNKMQSLPQYAQIVADLAVTKTNQGQWAEAEPLFLQSIAALPAGSLRRETVVSRLASLYSAQGRMADALKLFNEAIDTQRRMLPESLHGLIFSLQAIASCLLTEGRFKDAETTLREAWRLSQQLAPTHPLRAQSATYLASALFMGGHPERAAPLLKTAMKIYDGAPDQSCDAGAVLTNLARMQAFEKHYAMAEQNMQRVLTLFRQCYPPGHIGIGFAQENLAQLYIDQGRYEEARPLMEAALPIIRNAYHDMHPTLAATLFDKARLEAGLRQYDQADALFRESITGYERSADPHDTRLGSMLRTYALFLKKVHRNSEAAPLEARAKSIFAFQQHAQVTPSGEMSRPN